MRLIMKPLLVLLSKQFTPKLRTWQMKLPTLSSQPGGMTFAAGLTGLVPPHTNFGRPVPGNAIVSPQLEWQLIGSEGAAQARRVIPQRTDPVPIWQPTLAPVIVKLCWASSGCVDGRNAPEGTSGFLVLTTVLVTVRLR